MYYAELNDIPMNDIITKKGKQLRGIVQMCSVKRYKEARKKKI